MTRKSALAVGMSVVLAGVVATTVGFAGDADSFNAGAVKVFTYDTPTGEHFAAVALRAAEVEKASPVPRDYVVLVDTSASQVGEHRTQALAVVDALLKALPATSRVCLASIDVSAKRMSEGFVAPQGREIDAAMTQLNHRTPLGATDLHAGLGAALSMFEANRPGAILYVGDGMSVAQLVSPEKLDQLTTEMRNRRISVHSYAVGPQTDLQLLGCLALQTGGTLRFDSPDGPDFKPAALATELVASLEGPVYYPTQLKVAPDEVSLLPLRPLPLRTDRDTIYIANGSVDGSMEIQAQLKDGDTVSWKPGQRDRQRGPFSMLPAVWKQAEADRGLTLCFASLDILAEAQRRFEGEVGRLVGTGQQALVKKNLQQAAQIAETVKRIDPSNRDADTLLEAVGKVRRREVAQVQPAAPAPAAPAAKPAEKAAKKPADAAGPAKKTDDVLKARTREAASPEENLIQQARERVKVISQQLSHQISEGVEEALRLTNEDPDAAHDRLKSMLSAIVSTPDVDSGVRDELTRRVQNAMQQVAARKQVIQQSQVQAQEQRALKESQKMIGEKMIRDEQTFATLISQVRALLIDAYYGEYESYEKAETIARVALDMAPYAGVAMAAVATSESAGQIDKINRLRWLRADRFLEVLYQVELSHVPFPDEPPIRWPSAEVWRALSERRKKWASVSLINASPNEERIRERLNDKVNFSFVDEPFRSAMDFIHDAHEIPIILDQKAFNEAGIDPEVRITHQLAGITLRNALRLILDELELEYSIEHEVMKITTQAEAAKHLSTRIYYVGDLAIPIPSGGGGMMGGGMGMGGMGGGMGMGGMGGGMGMGGMGGGMGGMGGGMGMYSVPAEQVPDLNRPIHQPDANPDAGANLDGKKKQ